jgi:Flp pilus assembly pilin Flp
MRPGLFGPLKEASSIMRLGILSRLWKNEQGGEVLEYALIAGLIVVASIAIIGTVGTKVLARWNGVNSGL